MKRKCRLLIGMVVSKVHKYFLNILQTFVSNYECTPLVSPISIPRDLNATE